MADLQQNLNTYLIEDALEQALPGVTFNTVSGITHREWYGDLWSYKIRVFLRTKSDSASKYKPGTGQIWVMSRFDGSNKTLRHAVVSTSEEIKAQLTWFRGYILGLVETFCRALNEPPPELEADIFSEEP